MIHPSYTELIQSVNAESEGETPVVNSRYSIVMAVAKRARQIISGDADVTVSAAKKPLSTAVEELYSGKVRIISAEDPADDERIALSSSSLTFAASDDTGADDEKAESGEEDDYDDDRESDEDDEDEIEDSEDADEEDDDFEDDEEDFEEDSEDE